MKLIIVRHGETEANVKGVLQGSLDTTLNKNGRIQARSLGLKLKSENIDVIFSSDLRRAKQTAEEIIRFHNSPVYYAKEIRERAGGIFEGKPYMLLKEAADKSGLPFEEYKPIDGESLTEVKSRMRLFLRKIYAKYRGKTVLIVTHGGVTRAIASIYLKVPIEELADVPTYNTGVLVISVQKARAKKLKDDMFIWGKRIY